MEDEARPFGVFYGHILADLPNRTTEPSDFGGLLHYVTVWETFLRGVGEYPYGSCFY